MSLGWWHVPAPPHAPNLFSPATLPRLGSTQLALQGSQKTPSSQASAPCSLSLGGPSPPSGSLNAAPAAPLLKQVLAFPTSAQSPAHSLLGAGRDCYLCRTPVAYFLLQADFLEERKCFIHFPLISTQISACHIVNSEYVFAEWTSK